MKKIQLNDLNEAAQKVLADVGEDESIVIEDENGRARYGVIPYRKPSEQQKQRGWETLRSLQKHAAAAMEKHGKTEQDLMDVILEDD